MTAGGKHFKSSAPTPQPATWQQPATQHHAARGQRPLTGESRPHAPQPAQRPQPIQAPRPAHPGDSVSRAAQAPRPAFQQPLPSRSARPSAHGAQPQPSAYARPQGSRAGNGAARPPRRRNVLSTALIAIGVVLLLVAGGLFIKAQLGYKQAAEFYDGLTSEVVKDSGSKIPKIDFAALKETNPDVVGWIYVPNTNINYVVAQGTTNDTYLRTLITGEYNANGTVFLDADQEAPGMVGQQTTLYGHHMNDGSMFSFINDTLNQEQFDAVEVVYYITPEKTYELKPMFTMQVDDDYVDARVGTFESEQAFTEYLSASLKHAKASAQDASDQIASAKQVMALVTCEDAFLSQTKRAVMVCTLVGEMDTVSAGEE